MSNGSLRLGVTGTHLSQIFKEEDSREAWRGEEDEQALKLVCDSIRASHTMGSGGACHGVRTPDFQPRIGQNASVPRMWAGLLL